MQLPERFADLLNGDVALVTGAAQGNGAAIARGLAACGAKVCLADVQTDAVMARASEITEAGGTAIGLHLDVSDREDAQSVAARVERDLGAVSVLVNNAGILKRTPVADDDFLASADDHLRINAGGVLNVTKAFLPQLRRTKGRVVNMGSICSYISYANVAGYAASKGAVKMITKGLAVELAADGIRVNGLAPGVIATPMTEATRNDPERLGGFLAKTPMGRVGEPEELIGPVLFLASDLSSYVTGHMLAVDGGFLAG